MSTREYHEGTKWVASVLSHAKRLLSVVIWFFEGFRECRSGQIYFWRYCGDVLRGGSGVIG